MHKHPVLSYALIALVVVLANRVAVAQSGPDPAQIAQTCIERVNAMAQARAQRNANIAANCVDRIGELLDAGEDDQALIAGARCIDRIRHRSRATTLAIKHRCFHCRQVLHLLGAPGIALVVREACEDAVQVVRISKATAIAAVRSALPDP